MVAGNIHQGTITVVQLVGSSAGLPKIGELSEAFVKHVATTADPNRKFLALFDFERASSSVFRLRIFCHAFPGNDLAK